MAGNPHLPRLNGSTRAAIKWAQDQIDVLRQAGAPTTLGRLSADVDCGRQRLTQVADAIEAYDAVNVRTLRAYVAAQLSTFARQTSAGGGGDEGGGSTNPGTGTHPDISADIATAKSDLIAAGISLVGPCGGFEIIKLVTYRLRTSYPTIGILDKPSGTNCTGYSVDIIVFQDGEHYDALNDSGGANGPQWDYVGLIDATRWRAPIPGSIP